MHIWDYACETVRAYCLRRCASKVQFSGAPARLNANEISTFNYEGQLTARPTVHNRRADGRDEPLRVKSAAIALRQLLMTALR